MTTKEETRIVMPLFSKVVCVNKLKLPHKKIDKLIDHVFVRAEQKLPEDPKNMTSYTVDKNILDQEKFSFLKKIITKEFNFYVKQILRYEQKFKITTSWFTKTEKGEESSFHNHRNSFISCILYIDVDEKSGPLSFIDYNNNKMFQLLPKEYNNFNSELTRIQPEKGMIIFFPSEMYHKVNTHESNRSRISLACNFIPDQSIEDISKDNFLHFF